jgi:saccharopine dehydrogenase-like NADP-dependent oxidoreductase
MKILVLGGYGVFGGRLVQLLLRDGHNVWVAGRSLQEAQRFTEQHQGIPLQLDRSRDLSPILDVRPAVVVDASGPFQAYGDDALRVPEFCLEYGMSYLDWSDDARFTTRISELDAKAKAAGCFALSGASSAPAISASVVTALAAASRPST